MHQQSEVDNGELVLKRRIVQDEVQLLSTQVSQELGQKELTDHGNHDALVRIVASEPPHDAGHFLITEKHGLVFSPYFIFATSFRKKVSGRERVGGGEGEGCRAERRSKTVKTLPPIAAIADAIVAPMRKVRRDTLGLSILCAG